MDRRLKRRMILCATAVALAVALGALVQHIATRALKSRVEQALGAESEVAAISVGWSAVEITGVRIRARRGWPVADALRARRVLVVPDLMGFISGEVRVRRITVEEPYVAAFRTRDGRLRVVPTLTEGTKQSTARTVTIGAIELRDGVLELHDATVSQRVHTVRLEQFQGSVEHLQFPGLPGRTGIDMTARIKAPSRSGTITVRGWTALSTRDTEITTRARGVDLTVVAPYLLKSSDIGVRRGTLDLDLDASVRKNMLRAPGKLTLTDLQLASGGGAYNTFMGVPRDAVIAALKGHDGRIVLQFTLAGNVSDPKFSLNESLALRIAASFADTLGVSVEGLARTVGDAARGVGGTVMKLFGE